MKKNIIVFILLIISTLVLFSKQPKTFRGEGYIPVIGTIKYTVTIIDRDGDGSYDYFIATANGHIIIDGKFSIVPPVPPEPFPEGSFIGNYDELVCEPGYYGFSSSLYNIDSTYIGEIRAECEQDTAYFYPAPKFKYSIVNDEYLNSEFQIFPNPSNNIIKIKLENPSENIKLYLTNMNGEIIKLIYEGISNSNMLELSTNDISSGNYFIILERAKLFYWQKIIIKK